MKYKKPIMRKKELMEEYGYPEAFLDRAYRTKGQTFAQKANPLKANSPVMFEVEVFEKWRLKELERENMAMPR